MSYHCHIILPLFNFPHHDPGCVPVFLYQIGLRVRVMQWAPSSLSLQNPRNNNSCFMSYIFVINFSTLQNSSRIKKIRMTDGVRVNLEVRYTQVSWIFNFCLVFPSSFSFKMFENTHIYTSLIFSHPHIIDMFLK